MEGLIPFVYRAIMDYKNGGRQGGMMNYACMSNESPSASYMRLPGDSGRFEASDIQLGFSTSSASPSAASKRMASAAGVQPCSWISSRAVKK
ncbi:uncharacterized protein LOC116007685 [Ipomoea triloba]|uniref:uncharacterized protein LOC116007685 n=1 Tax=Ipomoea triloba TaxID=35885 RepID=UPI00125D986D|nr:uncharacterized protein LOC116007685 [Ipomoea triloba]GME21193.1 leucine-rich repeat receptor-like protein kinase PEPR2 [Ipomoea batatas]